MNKQRQTEEAAKLEGWDMDPKEAHGWGSRGQWVKRLGAGGESLVSKNMNVPKYHTDYNAVHWLIAGMDYRQATAYHTALADITGCCVIGFIKATCAQMLEAILKAYGVWEES